MKSSAWFSINRMLHTVGQQYVAFLGRRQGGQGLAIIGDG
jgi:hypothetical protein